MKHRSARQRPCAIFATQREDRRGIALAHPETGRIGVRFVRDGVEVCMKPCNLELLAGSELHQEKLLKERLEWQQFVSSHPFPSIEDCLRNLHECTARVFGTVW